MCTNKVNGLQGIQSLRKYLTFCMAKCTLNLRNKMYIICKHNFLLLKRHSLPVICLNPNYSCA